ncbi:rna pseudouridine synthase 1 [Phtheirospermum japonicum]|uniref:Rna pseudouridine synthase 1 n=1 Tax=Phtheirospermum japonicum TaxID=374723 RepID=A0A830B184_9LAMI|nr:rna pseudouridine synthase 1 [Phtheirospermum japonicum]
MTRMPLCFHAPALLRVSKPLQFLSSTAAEANMNSPQTHLENAPKTLENYPVPLSPPPPLISKNIELNRALTASSKSSLFSLSRKDVIFEDDWLIAVNKPQGIYCETLLSAAHSLLDTNQGDKLILQELHLSNRLDRDTSGVTVITKSHKVAAKLVKAFTEHTVKKTYLASCVGKAPSWENMIVKSGHGRSKHGAWRVYACSDVGRTLPGGSYVRDMETSFQLLSINGRGLCEEELSGLEKLIVVEDKCEIDSSYTEKDEVVVRAYPRSGRTHQIRLHCQYLGISIRGDVKYDGVYEWKDRVYEGHELHAESLCFEHPVTGQSILIQAPLPLWASQALGQKLSS